MYKGELIAITVAVSWTACAMFAEVASKRLGSFGLNISRMILSCGANVLLDGATLPNVCRHGDVVMVVAIGSGGIYAWRLLSDELLHPRGIAHWSVVDDVSPSGSSADRFVAVRRAHVTSRHSGHVCYSGWHCAMFERS